MSKNGRYLELKAAHKCVRCREQDDRTLAGRVLCATCNEKFKGYRERPEYKYAHRNRNSCAACRIRQSERQKERRKKEKTAENGNSQTA